jgi:hypothetical protein
MSAGPSLCYLLLVHEHPRSWTALLRRLLEDGGHVVIHLDAKAPDEWRDVALAEVDDLHTSRLHWAERHDVRWGEWSMIAATLAGLAYIEDAGLTPDYVYLLSGSDYPIRPLSQLRSFLQRQAGAEFIECVDPETVRWVRGGPQQERYRYWHWVNWRSHPRLFSRLLDLQRRLGVRRELPGGMQPWMGSQWWVLTWDTCRAVLERSRDPDVVRFFRRTWVPDELFFQTLVMAVVDDPARVQSRQLTHHLFTDYGVPLVFANGHDAYLSRQPFFFARKLSPFADALRRRLDERSREEPPVAPDDAEVGRDTGVYHRFIARHRHGLEGRWSWGRRPHPRLGELGWNRRPYLLVSARSTEALEDALAVLRSCPGTRVHGRLFRPERIGFARDADQSMGYAAADTRIRDQDAPAFLADLVTDADQDLLCFGWLEGEDGASAQAPGGDLSATIAGDPRASWIRLDAVEAAAASGGLPSARQVPMAWDPQRSPESIRRLVASIHRPVDPAPMLDPTSAADLDALQRRQRLVIHIGVHRTGSTSIQHWCHANRKVLLEQGVLYPFDGVNHNELALLMETDWVAFDHALNALIDQATRSDAHTVVVSGEDFSWLRWPSGLERLGKVFDVRVLCYVRRQDEWLESWYNQNVKWPWNEAASSLTPGEFFAGRSAYYWIDYARTLQRWSAVFGRERIHVRPFDAVRSAGSVVDDFAEFCGFDLSRLAAPRAGDNASVSPQALMLLRLLALIDLSPAQRTELVAKVRVTFDQLETEPRRHVLSPAQRRAVLVEHADSNADVARTYLGRTDGVLFDAPPPPDDATPPAIGLPPVEAFREQIAIPLVRQYLRSLLRIRRELDWTDVAQDLVDRKVHLLHLESCRRRLERQLASPAVLRERLLGHRQTADGEASPGRHHSGEALDRIVTDLGLETLGPAQARQLRETLAGWKGRTGPAPGATSATAPDAVTEQLVRRSLEPLLRQFAWRSEAMRWLRRLPAHSWLSQRDRLDREIEARRAAVDELERNLSSRLRVALRLRQALRARRDATPTAG